MSPEALWKAFLRRHPELTGGTEPTYDAWAFGADATQADELCALVLAGKKRATTSALIAYELEDEDLPKVGEYSIITDGASNARCIIRTTKVSILPFNEVDADFAAREGEDDGSLESWRRIHQAVFSKELEALGRTMSPTMQVVCESFELLYVAESE